MLAGWLGAGLEIPVRSPSVPIMYVPSTSSDALKIEETEKIDSQK